MSRLAAIACLLLSCAAASAAPDSVSQDARNVVHVLDYVSVDYPEFVRDGRVIDQAEYQEQLEFAGQVIDLLRRLPDRPGKPALIDDARRLQQRIAARAPGGEVSHAAGELRWAVIGAYDLVVSPKEAPDLRSAPALYALNCASCHGVDGHGDGPAAKGMDPTPSNFHDVGRMGSRSLYGLYSTISLGVAGTSMPAFRDLSDAERWSLAFYVAGLGIDKTAAEQGAAQWRAGVARDALPSLREVATRTRNEVAREMGPQSADALAWLTLHPSALKSKGAAPIETSRRLLHESLEAYRAGDREAAQRLAVTAYLEGFELAEASLSAVDPRLSAEVERAMMAYRNAIRAGAPMTGVEGRARSALASLELAEERHGGAGLSPGTAAVSAFVILLREGLEAVLVVAAIVAFLVKAERREALRYVHAGWIGALLLGALTWLVGSFVIQVSGAARELTEGATALLAAAILLYVGFWLHSKAYAGRWQQFIAAHLEGALSKGTVWALAGVSFLAVYREAFETVLFYQAMWTQAGEPAQAAVIGGLVAAAAALAVVSWAIFRYGVRLPIGPFFAASSVLLAILAVVFVGQGVAALQEAGKIPADLLGVPSVPVLGIYPTVQTLAAQAVLLTLAVAGFVYSYVTARRASRVAL